MTDRNFAILLLIGAIIQGVVASLTDGEYAGSAAMALIGIGFATLDRSRA